jgi:hypothetical protein
MRFGDVSFLVNELSSAHDVTPPRIRFDDPYWDELAGIVEDRELIDSVMQLIPDASYEQPQGNDNGCLVFDAVLTERGNLVPVLLVVHEMAHHVEFMNTGRLSSHGDEFDEAFLDLLEHSMSLLKLDSWSESDWRRVQPTQPRGTSPDERSAAAVDVMQTKWSAYLGQ